MAQGRYLVVDVSTLDCHSFDVQDNTRALDVKTALSDFTEDPVQGTLLLYREIAIEDNVILLRRLLYPGEAPKDVIFLFSEDPLDCLRHTDPLFNQLRTVEVPEEREENWLKSCEKFVQSLQDLRQYLINKRDLLKEGEFQLRSYVRDYHNLVKKRVISGKMVLCEKLKLIKTTHDMACVYKMLLMIDTEAYKILDDSVALASLEKLSQNYSKLKEKLNYDESLLQTSMRSDMDTGQLLDCRDDKSLDKIKRNIYLMDTSYQRFKSGSIGDPGSELYELERKCLREVCAESSEHFQTVCQELTDGIVQTCMAQIRSHLESLEMLKRIAEDVHIICYENESIDIILEKCKKDIEMSKDMFEGGCGLGLGDRHVKDDRRPQVVTTKEVERDESEDEDESDDKISTPEMIMTGL